MELYLVFADGDYAGAGALRLAQVIHEQVRRTCRKALEAAAEAQLVDAQVTAPTHGRRVSQSSQTTTQVS